jgi:hypothetical protein
MNSIASTEGGSADVFITICMTGKGYSLTLGAMGFLSGDSTAPVCTITQGTGTPGKGIANTLTATCTDDTELAQITLYTDEGGTMAASSTYGSPAAATGTEKSATFEWNNPQITIGQTITWKVSATDTSGNVGESATLAFTVGAVADTFKPTVGVPTATPAMPKEGETVTITAQVSDDTALATANLLVGTSITGSAPVTGKSATASFTWTAGKAGTYTIKVKATDAAGNTADSPPLTVTVVPPGAVACDQATKPADVLGDCVDGFQTKTTYICDSATGTWKPSESQQTCAPAPPIAFIAVGLVALAIALAAAVYIVKKKKPEMLAKLKTGKGDKGKKVQPPATFG